MQEKTLLSSLLSKMHYMYEIFILPLKPKIYNNIIY